MADDARLKTLSEARLAWITLIALAGLHVALGVLLFDPKPFIGGDNAGYIILAESLEGGLGYRDIHIPGSPLHGQYPPFYPAILAVASVLGGGIIAFKVLSLIFTTASVAFTFLLARSRLGDGGGIAVAIPIALSPVLLYYSHWVLSEAPFVLLTLVGLWAAERMTQSRRWLALALMFALLAYLTRSAGLPLLVALMIALAWRRRWGELAIAGISIGAVVAGWWVWGRFAAAEGAQVYSSNFLLVNPYAPAEGYVGPGGLLARTVNNIRLYAVEVLPDSLAGQAGGSGLMLVATLIGLLLIASAAIAWTREVRNVRPLELFTLFYCGLIFLWPSVWTDRRFLLPLLPALITQAMAGVAWSFDFVKAKRPGWVAPLVGLFLALLAAPDHAGALGLNARCWRHHRQGDRLACYPPQWRALVQTADWVRENTPADAVVVTRKPRLFYLYSRRQGNVYPYTSDDTEMLAFFDSIGADYVVIAGLSQTTQRYLIPVITSVRERFEVAHRVEFEVGPDGARQTAAVVLRYLTDGATAPGQSEER